MILSQMYGQPALISVQVMAIFMSDLSLSVFSNGFCIPPIVIARIELVIDESEAYAASHRRLVYLWVSFCQSIVIRQNNKRKKEQLLRLPLPFPV